MASQLEQSEVVNLVLSRCAATSFPELSTVQVEDIVSASARTDADGHLPGDEDWTETYDVNSAIAAGWELKAAAAANRFSLTVDGQTLQRQQVVEHCLTMADRFRSRAAFVWPQEPR